MRVFFTNAFGHLLLNRQYMLTINISIKHNIIKIKEPLINVVFQEK
jgi:hypothetical protein